MDFSITGGPPHSIPFKIFFFISFEKYFLWMPTQLLFNEGRFAMQKDANLTLWQNVMLVFTGIDYIF